VTAALAAVDAPALSEPRTSTVALPAVALQ